MASPLRLKTSHASTVPKTARPVLARSLKPSTLRSSHSIFAAEKSGSSTSPVRSRTTGSRPYRAARRNAKRCDGPATRSRGATARRWRGPDAHRLALAGDSHGIEVSGPDSRVGQRVARDRERHFSDLGRVVFHPAGSREVLGKLSVPSPDDLRLLVEDQAGGARRPLIDRQDHWYLRAAMYPQVDSRKDLTCKGPLPSPPLS